MGSTVRQDTAEYRKAVFLGLREHELERLIRKQMLLVFSFPAVCGCAAAGLMINRFLSAPSIAHFREVTLAAAALPGIVLVFQALSFFAFQRLLIRSAVEAAYNR